MARLAVLLFALCALAPALALPQKGPRLAVAQGKAKAPGKVLGKVPGKVVAKKRKPVVWIPPPRVSCTTSLQNPPFRSTSCVVVSAAAVPLCVKMRCSPNPAGPCPTGQVDLQNRECAWAVNQGCTSPAPVQPKSSWGWGMMTTGDSPVTIRVVNWTVATGGKCPDTW